MTTKIYINPPPTDGCCDGCRRHVTAVPEQKLIKDWRGSECVSHYWECIDCMALTDEEFFAQWR